MKRIISAYRVCAKRVDNFLYPPNWRLSARIAWAFLGGAVITLLIPGIGLLIISKHVQNSELETYNQLINLKIENKKQLSERLEAMKRSDMKKFSQVAPQRNVSMTLRHLPCEFSVALFSSSPVLAD